MLKIDNLTFTYGTKLIFERLSLNARNNKLTLFLAPNSSGKTTLINLLSGLLPSNNSIKLSNNYLNQKSGKAYLRNMSTIFEDLDTQFISDNLLEELRFPLINLGYSIKNIDEMVSKQLEFFGIDYEHKKISKMTNLEKLISLLAVTTIHSPRFLFIDDVFNNLKSDEYIYVSKLLYKLTRLKKVAIFMTSSNAGAGLYFDYVYLFNGREIVLKGPLKSVLENDNILIKSGIKIPNIILTSVNLKNYEIVDDIYFEERTLVNKLWQ